MSCLEKKTENKKKYKSKVSRNKEIQSVKENDIRNIVSRNKETWSLKKQKKICMAVPKKYETKYGG